MMIIIYVSTTKNSLGWIDGGVWIVDKMRETIGQEQIHVTSTKIPFVCLNSNKNSSLNSSPTFQRLSSAFGVIGM